MTTGFLLKSDNDMTCLLNILYCGILGFGMLGGQYLCTTDTNGSLDSTALYRSRTNTIFNCTSLMIIL
jgi:hypothetical protein